MSRHESFMGKLLDIQIVHNRERVSTAVEDFTCGQTPAEIFYFKKTQPQRRIS
jgi:hypothetical protein